VRLVDQPIAFFLAARGADNTAAFDLVTRQPLILAIWPATEPVAPAAPDTTTVSPGLILPISIIPKYDVRPLTPKNPNARLGGVPGATFCIPPKPLPSVTT